MTPTTDGIFYLIVRVYKRALWDAQRGDVDAGEATSVGSRRDRCIAQDPGQHGSRDSQQSADLDGRAVLGDTSVLSGELVRPCLDGGGVGSKAARVQLTPPSSVT